MTPPVNPELLNALDRTRNLIQYLRSAGNVYEGQISQDVKEDASALETVLDALTKADQEVVRLRETGKTLVQANDRVYKANKEAHAELDQLRRHEAESDTREEYLTKALRILWQHTSGEQVLTADLDFAMAYCDKLFH